MALNRIVQVTKPPEEGGGLFGSILGGALPLVGGLIAAPFTGGASLAPALAVSGVGSTVGGIAGNMMDPAQAAAQSNSIPHIDSKQNRLEKMMKLPEVKLATMQNSKKLLAASDLPNADQYMSMLDQASEKLKSRLGNNSSLG